MRIDLHLHSRASDGHLTPTALASAAIAGGLDIIALTDHDTAAGVPELFEAARERPLTVISGIEVSARHGDAEIHVLGYYIDPSAPSIRAHEEASVQRRTDRMHGMIARLREQGLSVAYEDVLREAGPEAASLGRPHLARALLSRGQTRTYGEAFERYLHDGGSAFVPTEFPSVAEAIRTIRDAGGLAVWAHPPVELFEREIRTFASWGLNGVECFRPTTPQAESLLFETGARSLGLLRTGGSDRHGPHRSRLGDFCVREDEVREMLALGGLV
jgi:predicted metal-dependent phosphoesterase TrpH